MIVRTVEPRDWEEVIALGRTLHAKSARAHIAFDVDAAREALARCASSQRITAFVAERAGKIVGFVVGAEQRWAYLRGRYVTDVVFFATYPGAGRMLLDRLIAWGRERGADEALCGVSFGGKSAKGALALYTRAGFQHRGGMFAMNLRT